MNEWVNFDGEQQKMRWREGEMDAAVMEKIEKI